MLVRNCYVISPVLYFHLHYEKRTKLTEQITTGFSPAEKTNFFEVKINGFQRSEPATRLARVRTKLNRAAGAIDSSEVSWAMAFSNNVALTTNVGASGVPHQLLTKEDVLFSKIAALPATDAVRDSPIPD